MTPEGKIKDYLKRQCKKRGWDIFTTVAAGAAGWPDRMVIPAPGVIWWPELKASSTRHAKAHIEEQARRLIFFHQKGFPAAMLTDREGVDVGIRVIEAWLGWSSINSPPFTIADFNRGLVDLCPPLILQNEIAKAVWERGGK